MDENRRRDPVVTFAGVTKRLGQALAVRDVSFCVDAGEVFGLAGPNGAGKTTCVRLILGLLRPDQGQVRIYGRVPKRKHEESLGRVGFVLEHSRLSEDLTVDENLRLFARLYRVDQEGPRTRELLAFLRLQSSARMRAGHLSKGMAQKVSIARALIHDPSLLVLDEPAAGLDPVFQEEVRSLIRLLRSQGKAVFLCSHDLHDMERLCTRVAIIHEGTILAQGAVSEIIERSPYVKLAIPVPDARLEAKCREALSEFAVVREEGNLDGELRVLTKEADIPRVRQVTEQVWGRMAPEAKRTRLTLEDLFHAMVRRWPREQSDRAYGGGEAR
jgi:ABC-2 type transport system ATP-binding protein